MGTLNVNVYTYHPKRIFQSEDMASDLQALLRTATGGGNGDTTKLVHLDMEVVMGSIVIVAVTKS